MAQPHRFPSLDARRRWPYLGASPSLVSSDLALRIFSAVIPVAALWVAKLIIDRVAAAAGHPGPMTRSLWLLVGAEFLLATLGTLCGRAVDFCETRIAEEFSREISQKIIRHATHFALALAYLRQAEILILDEPTAALDAEAEHEVYTQFAELATDRMVLLISHRFATVRIADRILVLDEGQLREQGTHDDLVAQQGLYANMFELQVSNYR